MHVVILLLIVPLWLLLVKLTHTMIYWVMQICLELSNSKPRLKHLRTCFNQLSLIATYFNMLAYS